LIPLTRPTIGEEEVEAASRVIRSGWLSQGEEVATLEKEFAAYLDATCPPYVVAVSSCTAALHLTLVASDATRVLCPSYTFVATANAAIHAGSYVTLSDVSIETSNLDPRCVEGFAGTVIPVHQVGLPCDMYALRRSAPEARFIEDAACAIGARYGDGYRVGTLRTSLAACFSLHSSKSLGCGEGGLVATYWPDLAERVRRLRQHGVNVGAENRKDGRTEETYEELGWNYRMTDLQAAIARVQLKRADWIVEKRREKARVYSEAFGNICRVPTEGNMTHAYQRYMIRTRNKDLREKLVLKLQEAGISCRRGIQCIHRQPYWHTKHGELRVTEILADTSVQLPLWADMPEIDQARVIEVVRSVL
jgi:perosamine synthetase